MNCAFLLMESLWPIGILGRAHFDFDMQRTAITRVCKEHSMATKYMESAFATPREGKIHTSPSGVVAAPERTGMKARLGRWIGLLVVVSAMTLLLAGSMAEPAAAARPNLGTVAERCTDMGGDPSVYGVLGVTFTYCDWGDGTGVWGVE
jgi:hypothetical protein